MEDLTPLHEQAEKIRASGVLGKTRLLRLFNFLVECSVLGNVPKEAIIGAEVFNKIATFDVSQDSIVRVYVYNLRRKLDEFYAGPGKGEPLRLALPKGEYRLVLVAQDQPTGDDPMPPQIGRRRPRTLTIAAGLAIFVCALNLGFDIYARAHNHWVTMRNDTIWSRLLQNGKPIVIVLGDYYIFGDTEQTSDVKRLIREFSINSRDDLERYLQTNPNLAEHYMDVGLQYLPTSSAFALANIAPILATTDKPRLRVVLMSALDPETIKSANIVYIGLLSGLGNLQRVVFARSRFRVGDSFDELIDQKTGHHYFSSAPQYGGESKPVGSNFGYHDYGFFSTFSGLGGNYIVIVAGTQDEGLRQMVEALTDRPRLDELTKQLTGKTDFEALIEVLGMNSQDLNGTLLVASPLNSKDIWTAQ